jgi:hypothetical protein
VSLKQDFGGHCHCFKEDNDPQFSEPLLKDLEINVFSVEDHAHDKVNGRFAGVLGMVQLQLCLNQKDRTQYKQVPLEQSLQH